MDFLHEMKKILNEQKEIALATSMADKPNVRILNFVCDKERRGVIYFSTFPDNDKVKEFLANDKVALTSIPYGESRHVRVHDAKVLKSDYSVYDLRELFVEKIPDYNFMIEEAGDVLEVYEIHFSEAKVIIDHTTSGSVTV